jgi:Family of unknown function (DUF5703)
MAEYSYLVLNLPRGTSRDAARRILTEHAEYGYWELSRLRLYADGSRKATLRRKVIRAVRTRLPGPWPAGYLPVPGVPGSQRPVPGRGQAEHPPRRFLPPETG